ncbi:MAG: HipA domain-containing protein [Myxococcales bacterium]
MTASCWICLGNLTTEEEPYHAKCLRPLFGSARAPSVELGLAKLHTAGLAMVGHTSISGVQRKISVGLSSDRSTLQVAIEGGRYLLKPASHTFPHLPENEHVTMRIAALVGIEIPPCGLIRLADGSVAYVCVRFDRPAGGGKLRQEDFCQLAERSPKEKYQGSAELCVRLAKRYASEPLIEVLRLYRQLLFAWWTGNGDMHLKNFSLLTGGDGLHRLSPAYDLLCTRLVLPEDRLALPVGGKPDHLTRRSWLDLADYAGIGPRAAERVVGGITDHVAAAAAMVERSALPQEMKGVYQALLRERASVIAGR